MRYDFLGLGTIGDEYETCYICGEELVGDEIDKCDTCRELSEVLEDKESDYEY